MFWVKVIAWNLVVMEQIKGKDEMQVYRDWLSEKLEKVMIFEGSFLAMLEVSIKQKKRDHPKELFFIEKYNKLEWPEDGLKLNVSIVILSEDH